MLGQKAFWPFDPSILHIVKNGHCFIFETQRPFFFYSPTSCFPITTLHLFFHIPVLTHAYRSLSMICSIAAAPFLRSTVFSRHPFLDLWTPFFLVCSSVFSEWGPDLNRHLRHYHWKKVCRYGHAHDRFFALFLLSYLTRVRRAGLEPAFCASLFS